MDKPTSLARVTQAHDDYRSLQEDVLKAREEFIDAIVDARTAKATQQEIAEQCIIDPQANEHLSRQRVAQFIDERKGSTNVVI